jgi:hypothetical protein
VTEAGERISSAVPRVFFSPPPQSALDAARMNFHAKVLAQALSEIGCA